MASIHKRGPKKDGTYSYRLMWRDPEFGPRHETFQDKTEAEIWKRLLDANGQSLAVATSLYENAQLAGPTVVEALREHIAQIVGATEYTISRYEDDVRLHFSGDFGGLKLKGLKSADITRWVKWMEGRGKSPKTISLKHGLLSAAMETAVRHGHIDRNPCKGVRLPKKKRVGDDGDDITMGDYQTIRAHMDPHFHPFVDFLVGTGCRFSEATALLGRDFDLDGNPPVVFINKAHKLAAAGGRYVGSPKTEKSRRRVSLAPSTVTAVAPLVEKALKDGGPVFRMKRAGEFTAQAFYNRGWRDARKAAGFGPGSQKHVTVHSLRHLHAALLLGNGMNMYELSRRLGHNNIQTTIDLYSSLLPDAHFRGAEVATRALEI